MIKVTLTTNADVIKGIYYYMRTEHGMTATTEEEADEIMIKYLDAFIDEHGIDLALSDGLLVPTITN